MRSPGPFLVATACWALVGLCALSILFGFDFLNFMVGLMLVLPATVLQAVGIESPLVDAAHGPPFLTGWGIAVVYFAPFLASLLLLVRRKNVSDRTQQDLSAPFPGSSPEGEPDKVFAVPVLLPSGERVPGEFRAWEQSPEDAEKTLVVLRFSGRFFQASEETYFAALNLIRQQLEPDGIIPDCYVAAGTYIRLR